MNSMYFNQYSVKVTPGREVQDGYVLLHHGDVYTLTLRNDRDVRCDAYVRIDGQDVIGVRLDPHTSVTIDGPTDDQGRNIGRLTFYRAGTSEFRKIHGDNVPADEQGLVSVTFRPEKGVLYRPQPKSFPTGEKNSGWEKNSYGSGRSYSPFQSASSDSNSDAPIASASAGNYGDTKSLRSYGAGYDADLPDEFRRRQLGSSLAPGATGLTGQSSQEFKFTTPLTYDFENERIINLRLVVDDNEPRPLTTKSTPVPPPVGGGNWR